MEKTYRNTSYFILLLFVVVVFGFCKSYPGTWQNFQSTSYLRHFHTLLFTSWFLLLIMQPILIGRGFIQTHKFIGKLSYGLAPLVVVSILFVAREKYFRLEHEVSASQNLGELTVNVCSMFYFSLLYVLAIYFRKNTAFHMRFMISSALLVLDPGLGRIFTNHIGTSFDDSVVYSVIITEFLTVILLVNDLRKGLPYIPYTLSLFFLASFQILWAFRYSDIWQAFLSGFVKLVF